jgi:CubicO group peptidase (beta-lactamase class C family)
MRDHGVPGVAVALAAKGEIVYSATYGFADLEMSVPVTSRTLFRTASVLKPMTATAVMMLAVDGDIDLDESIQVYCPAYPEKRWPVTPRELIAHAGGVRPSVLADVFNREHYGSVAEALTRFAGDSLVAQPGTSTTYSNAGYTLLACAIEGASGVSYDGYMRDHVFDPAGMTDTRRDNSFAVIPERARAYMLRTEQNTEEWMGLWQPRHLSDTEIGVPFNADPVDPSWAPGAGGYLTTPVDLVRFASALMDGQLLSADYVASIAEPYRLSNGESVPRSHGWILGDFNGHTTLSNLGSDWNGSSALWVLPADSLAIAVSTNKGFEQPGELVEALAVIWRD